MKNAACRGVQTRAKLHYSMQVLLAGQAAKCRGYVTPVGVQLRGFTSIAVMAALPTGGCSNGRSGVLPTCWGALGFHCGQQSLHVGPEGHNVPLPLLHTLKKEGGWGSMAGMLLLKHAYGIVWPICSRAHTLQLTKEKSHGLHHKVPDTCQNSRCSAGSLKGSREALLWVELSNNGCTSAPAPVGQTKQSCTKQTKSKPRANSKKVPKSHSTPETQPKTPEQGPGQGQEPHRQEPQELSQRVAPAPVYLIHAPAEVVEQVTPAVSLSAWPSLLLLKALRQQQAAQEQLAAAREGCVVAQEQQAGSRERCT